MRPPGYEPGELPTAPLRVLKMFNHFVCSDYLYFLFAIAKVELLYETAKLSSDFFEEKYKNPIKLFASCLFCYFEFAIL